MDKAMAGDQRQDAISVNSLMSARISVPELSGVYTETFASSAVSCVSIRVFCVAGR